MTTLQEIEIGLPNGFHDAQLCGVSVDYEHGEAVMLINADISDPSGTGEPEYRAGRLTIKGLAFLSMDAPRAIAGANALWIGSGAGQPSTAPIELPQLPEDCFLHWFFVNEWNGFIRVAARDAEFQWVSTTDPASP